MTDRRRRRKLLFALALPEIALVLVRLDHVAALVVNAHHRVGFRLVSIRRLVDVICFCDRRIGQSRFVSNRF
jgi:hypothetical protein